MAASGCEKTPGDPGQLPSNRTTIRRIAADWLMRTIARTPFTEPFNEGTSQ
jgi:hypothetical protein